MTKIDTKKPPVKEDENFIENDSDKRVIVFVVVAILVIIVTIIGILVGCQKEEKDDTKEPDIVVPGDKDEDEEKDEEDDTDIIVKKVTSTSSDNNKNIYEVLFYYNDLEDFYIKEVKEGKKVSAFVPEGFESCRYYTSSELTTEFNFNTKITSDTSIYMDCIAIEYTIIYDKQSVNPTTYSVTDGTVLLNDPYSEIIFVGWYDTKTFENKVTALTPSIISLANENKEIHLYAKEVDSLTVTYLGYNDTSIINDVTKLEMNNYEVASPIEGMCDSETNFLGWTKTQGGNKINANPGSTIEVDGDITFYAVCGAAKVIYASEGNVVEEVGYTKEDLESYELPDAEELDMEVPTYFVPVEQETETSKKVVDDTAVVGEKEIKLSDVQGKEGTGYTSQVGDNVEELEKIFDGWSKEDTDTSSPTYGQQVEVPDDFVPEENSDTTLNAIWEEQPIENLET